MSNLVRAGTSRNLAAPKRDLIESMTPALREVYEAVAAEIKQQVEDNIWFYYRLGSRVLEVSLDSQKYGQGAVEKLAAALCIDRGLVYKAKHFAEMFSEKQIRSITEKSAEKGGYITWTHFVQLLHIADEKKRNRLLDRAIDGRWSVRDLADAVKEEKSKDAEKKAKSSEGEDASGKSKTVSAICSSLYKIHSHASKFLEKNDEAWEGEVLPALKSMDLSQASDSLYASLWDVENLYKEIVSQLEGAISQIAHYKTMVKASLNDTETSGPEEEDGDDYGDFDDEYEDEEEYVEHDDYAAARGKASKKARRPSSD